MAEQLQQQRTEADQVRKELAEKSTQLESRDTALKGLQQQLAEADQDRKALTEQSALVKNHEAALSRLQQQLADANEKMRQLQEERHKKPYGAGSSPMGGLILRRKRKSGATHGGFGASKKRKYQMSAPSGKGLEPARRKPEGTPESMTKKPFRDLRSTKPAKRLSGQKLEMKRLGVNADFSANGERKLRNRT